MYNDAAKFPAREVVMASNSYGGAIRRKFKIKLQRAYRWMPWHQAPKKDAISCEKPRLAANGQRVGDLRMRKRTRKGIP